MTGKVAHALVRAAPAFPRALLEAVDTRRHECRRGRLKPAPHLYLILIAAMLAACGYHRAGRGDLLPKNLKTIAIPAFGNVTMRYKLSDRLPLELTREFHRRTRYEVVADPNAAGAILQGTVARYNAYPTVFDPVTGRPAGLQVIVVLQLRLVERESGKVLFDRPAFESRQRYEISVDQEAFFEESGVALERLSREVARNVVSAILEAF